MIYLFLKLGQITEKEYNDWAKYATARKVEKKSKVILKILNKNETMGKMKD